MGLSQTGYGRLVVEVSANLQKRFDLLRQEVAEEGTTVSSLTQKFIEAGDALSFCRREGDLLAVLMGFGSGATYVAVTRSRGFEKYSGVRYRVHHIHNVFLAFFFRYGIIGFGLFCAFLLSLFRMQWSLVVRSGQAGDPLVRVFVKSTFVYLCISLFIIFFFSFFYRDLIWGVLIGVMGLLDREGRVQQTQVVRASKREK